MLYETVMTSDSGQAATFFLFRSFLPAPLGFFFPPKDGRLRNENRLAPQCGGVLGDQVWR